jgi:SAM-dependent methyltransferase
MAHTAASFDALFTGSSDPWAFKSRWYEERKRAVTLACLPARSYAFGYEPGCANGELSAALATRCGHLLVSDGSAKAVALARQRLAELPHVEVRQSWVPDAWPDERFDLVVVSELGYFLSAAALDVLIGKARDSLAAGGTLLACHWRHPPDDCELDGDAVHRRFGRLMEMPHLAGMVDDDFRIDVWCRDGRSVAQREGFI